MSEYTAPVIQNNLTPARLLTNPADNSIVLKLYKNFTDGITTKDIIYNISNKQSLLYSDIVDSNKSSAFYNEDIISEYISLGVLSDTLIQPSAPMASYANTTGANHSISLNSLGQLLKTQASAASDNLETTYCPDINDKIRLIAYRGLTGISYSADGGATILATPSLSYPSEVTSVAIQAYDQYNVQLGKPKIFIGTLREGLKSYTIGDSEWKLEGDLEFVTPNGVSSTVQKERYFLFRQSKFKSVDTVSQIEPDGYKYKQEAGNFEPCYVVNIANYPLEAGNPILVYSRTTIEYNTGTNDITDRQITTKNYFRYLVKYLHPASKKLVLDTTYNIYRAVDKDISNLCVWKEVDSSETGTTQATQIIGNTQAKYTFAINTTVPTFSFTKLPQVIDINKSVPYEKAALSTDAVSNLTALTTVKNNRYLIELYKIEAFNEIGSDYRGIKIHKYIDVGSNIVIEASNFSGLSVYTDSANKHIFLTEQEKIWRYSNTSWWKSGAYIIPWLTSSDSTKLNFRLSADNLFVDQDIATTYLKGLKGFGIIPNKKSGEYLGILASDLGHVVLNLITNSTDQFAPADGPFKTFYRGLFPTSVCDFQLMHETNEFISCGMTNSLYVSYVPNETMFSAPIRNYLVIPTSVSTLPSSVSTNELVQKFYKNYTLVPTTQTIFHNKFTSTITEFNIEQYYQAFIYNADIKISKSWFNEFLYNNGFTYQFLETFTTPTVNLQTAYTQLYKYVKNSFKYNRIKLLLRVSETPSADFIGSIIESEIEIPYLPDNEIPYTLP